MEIHEAFLPLSSLGFTAQKYLLIVNECNMDTYLQVYFTVNHEVNGFFIL